MKKHVFVFVTIVLKFTEECSSLQIKHSRESFELGVCLSRASVCLCE